MNIRIVIQSTMSKQVYKIKKRIGWFLLLGVFSLFHVSAQEYLCPDRGVSSEKGNAPGFIAMFSNGEKIIMCSSNHHHGKETFYDEEFSIYNCGTNKSFITEYSALDTCRIDFKNDTLQITKLKRLAIGENWKIESVDYETTWLYFVKDSLHMHTEITIPKFTIPQKKIDEFYKSLKNPSDDQSVTIYQKIGGQNDIIKKLEILSVYGDNTAYKLLKKKRKSAKGIEGLGGESLMECAQALRMLAHIRKSSKNKKRFRLSTK